jgi:hypothetical protein
MVGLRLLSHGGTTIAPKEVGQGMLVLVDWVLWGSCYWNDMASGGSGVKKIIWGILGESLGFRRIEGVLELPKIHSTSSLLLYLKLGSSRANYLNVVFKFQRPASKRLQKDGQSTVATSRFSAEKESKNGSNKGCSERYLRLSLLGRIILIRLDTSSSRVENRRSNPNLQLSGTVPTRFTANQQSSHWTALNGIITDKVASRLSCCFRD